MRLRCAAAAVAVIALAGCWPQPADGPSRQRSNGAETTLTAANVASLAPVWTATLGAPVGGEPIVSGTRAFARTMASPLGSGSSRVVSLDAATGATLWDHGFAGSFGFPDQYNPVTLTGDSLLARRRVTRAEALVTAGRAGGT
jgi:outer membrane protein assembly factor BamB